MLLDELIVLTQFRQANWNVYDCSFVLNALEN